MQNRREFLTRAAGLSATLALPGFAWGRCFDEVIPAPSEFEFALRKLDAGGYLVGKLSDGGNVYALDSTAGPILVDSKYLYSAPDLKRQMIKLFGERVPTLVINTHHHADHIGGNWLFKLDALIIAHKNVKSRLDTSLKMAQQHVHAQLLRYTAEEPNEERSQAMAEIAGQMRKFTYLDFSANIDVDEERAYKHGSVPIVMRHLGPAHTDNDMVVHFPQQNVLHAGDLIFDKLHPFIDTDAGASVSGWEKALAAAYEMCDEKTVVIPGHGQIGDRSALQRQAQYFDDLRTVVTKAIDEGMPKEEIYNLTMPPSYNDYGFTAMQTRNMAAMMEHINAERAAKKQ